MKRLRILTGTHVGGHLDLSSGTHLLGAGNECDITITDWTFAPLELVVDDQSVTCRWSRPGKGTRGSESAPVERRIALDDFEPREFDGIVLCAGPVDKEWPSDVKLLSLVFAIAPKRVVKWARRRFPAYLVPFGLASALVAGAVMAFPLLKAAPPAAAAPTIAEVRAQLQHALDRVAGAHLATEIQYHTIYVTGMVEDAREATASRAVLSAHRGPYPLVPRFAVAADIAETIRGTAGLTNPTVRHLGNGVFSVTADVTDERAARAALDRMSADLAPSVKKITASLEKIYPNDPLGPILSRSQQEGLSVVQTRDGVRHLVMDAADAQQNLPHPAQPTKSRARPAHTPAVLTATANATKGPTP